MLGLDEKIASLGQGDAFVLIAVMAVLLGLRHATDPDHLTTVSMFVASEDDRSARRAGALGMSWGAGHATTLIVFGLPIVLFNSYLPERVQQAAELAIGLVIIALALRLLIRWRRGYFHVHVHTHGGTPHSHLHMHEHARHKPHPEGHEHPHAAGMGRSPLQAYGIGLVHGLGGSAGVGVLLLAAIPNHVEGVIALLLFALFTAVSMAIVSTGFGYTLSRGPVLRRFLAVAPALGALSLAFGALYALGAVSALP